MVAQANLLECLGYLEFEELLSVVPSLAQVGEADDSLVDLAGRFVLFDHFDEELDFILTRQIRLQNFEPVSLEVMLKQKQA